MKNILVTGGAGYIGSHTCVELAKAGYGVIVVDNLVNSKYEAVRRVEKIIGKPVKFYENDILDAAALDKIFTENQIDAVIIDDAPAQEFIRKGEGVFILYYFVAVRDHPQNPAVPVPDLDQFYRISVIKMPDFIC